MELRGQVVEGLRAVGLGTGFVAALKLVQLVILARLLAPDDFGVMAMAGIVMGLFSHFAEIGAGSVVIHRQDLADHELNALFWIGVAVGAVLLVLLWFASPTVASFFDEPRLVDVLIVLSVTFVVSPLGLPYRSLLERDLDFRRVAVAEASGALVGAGTAIGLATIGVGLMSIAYGLVAATVTNMLFFVATGWRRWRPAFSFSSGALVPHFGFGAHLTGQRLVNYVTANTDFFLIGTFLGSHVLGFYSVAYNLANIPSSHVNSVLSRVSYAALARMQDDLGQMRRAYLRFQEMSGLLNAPILFGLAAMAPVAIPSALGATWQPAVALLQILCIVGLTRSIGGTVGPLLLARGRPDLGFRWSLLVVALQVPCLVLGLQFGGAYGIALGFAAAQIVLLLLNYLILVRTLLGPCRDEYLHSVALPMKPAAVMGAIAFALWLGLEGKLPPLALLAVQFGVGTLTYVAFLLLLRPTLLAEFKQLFASWKT